MLVGLCAYALRIDDRQRRQAPAVSPATIGTLNNSGPGPVGIVNIGTMVQHNYVSPAPATAPTPPARDAARSPARPNWRCRWSTGSRQPIGFPVTSCRYNLAVLSQRQGDPTTARHLLTELIAGEERTLGAQNPTIALSRASLASCAFQLDDRAAVRALAERARADIAGQPPASPYRTRVEELIAPILADQCH